MAAVSAPEMPWEGLSSEGKEEEQEKLRYTLSSIVQHPDGLEAALQSVREPCAAAVEALKASDGPQVISALQRLQQAIERCPAAGLRACVEEAVAPAKLALQSHFQLSSNVPWVSLRSRGAEAGLRVFVSAIARAQCSREHHSDVGLAAVQLGAIAAAKAERNDERVRHAAAGAIEAGAQLAASLLSSDNEASTLGHAISSALSIVSTEDARGTSGSKDARLAALRATRVLVQEAGSASALAFFLPGTASGITKALAAAHPDRAGPASASAGSSATAEALRALSSLISCVLSDSANCHLHLRNHEMRRNGEESKAVLQLHKMAAGGSDHYQESESVTSAPANTDAHEWKADASAQAFRVLRTEEWRSNVEDKLCELFESAVRPLIQHQHSKVRVAYGQLAGSTMLSCASTVPELCKKLLEDLLPLVSDQFPQVQQAAKHELECLQTRRDDVLATAAPVTQSAFRSLARKCQLADKQHFISSSKLLTTSLERLQFDGNPTGLLQGLQPSDFWSILEHCFHPKARTSRSMLLLDSDGQWQASENDANETCTACILPSLHVEELERLETERSRDAAIDACRALGSAARRDGILESIVIEFCRRLRSSRSDVKKPSASLPWQRHAAAQLKAASEVIVGSAQRAVEDDKRMSGNSYINLIAAMHSEVTSPAVWGSSILQEDDALLAKACCEFVGACARALGDEYQECIELLPTALPKLLRRLGSSDREVSAAASNAMRQIGASTGSGPSLRAVVVAHSDYVIDALSSQLRRLGDNPQAPELFAAALERAGASKDLLPLLAEPLQHAADAVSAKGRSHRPQHVMPFLGMLREVSKAAEVEASTMASNSTQLADGDQLPPDKVRRAEIAAKAAARVSHSCAPSTRDRSLKVRLRALECAQHSLRALRGAADAGAADEYGAPRRRAAACGFKSGGWGLGSYQRSTPDQAQRDRAELMPAVVASWPTVIAALRDRHPEGVRAGCEMLCDACEAASGSFLSRRVADEALPELIRLIDEGLPHVREEQRPEQWRLAQQSRVHLQEAGSERASDKACTAVLQAISIIASSPRASGALMDAVPPLAERLPPYLGDATRSDVRQSAAEAAHALHCFDPDQVYLALAETAYASAAAAEGNVWPEPPHSSLPSYQSILPVSSSKRAPRGAARNAARLLRMLERDCRAPRWKS